MLTKENDFKPFGYDQMREVADRLDSYHGIFNQLWSLGVPVFTTSLETAAVWFDDIGDAMHMEINPEFWKKLNVQHQNFIICHECSHVLLAHGARAVNCPNVQLANIAMDIVVNELLVREFGFSRKQIDPENLYCWRDKVIPPKSKITPLETFEWYYNYMVQKLQTGASFDGAGELVDDHSKLSDADASRMVQRAVNKLSNEEAENLGDKIRDELNAMAGTGTDQIVAVMNNGPVRPKPKWESIVKSRLMKYLGDNTVESWAHINRRLVTMHNKAILPVEVDDEDLSPTRRQIYLFLDTSGSCQSLAPRFWELARSIPRSKFEVHPFCFDTKVYDISFKDKKLYGFGGTRFDIIENRIQKEVIKGKVSSYPDAVFVVTDGWGSKVKPEKPENWHVLLTKGGSRADFPGTCKFYDLSEFE